jgi:hypothetical protein
MLMTPTEMLKEITACMAYATFALALAFMIVFAGVGLVAWVVSLVGV